MIRFRRTAYDKAAHMGFRETDDLGAGAAVRTADGALYVVGETGSLHRVGKPKGTKKQRRQARARAKRRAKLDVATTGAVVAEPADQVLDGQP